MPWDHLLSQGILTNALEMFQALDLFLRQQSFFDLASFTIIRGWLRELAQRWSGRTERGAQG